MKLLGYGSDWWNFVMLVALGLAAIAAFAVVITTAAVIVVQKREAIEASRAFDRYKSDAGARIATANAQAAQAYEAASRANERTEQLRADNLALQAGLRPRRFSFLGWTTNPKKIDEIYAPLTQHAGTIALIQAVPDFEAQMFANDIAAVLASNGWKPRIVTEKESRMSDLSFSEGLFIFPLSADKSLTDAATVLWIAMVDAFHEMGGQPFEGAPIQEILDAPKPGYPHFDPPIHAIFVRVGLRQNSSEFLEIQRRELLRQEVDWNDKMKEIIKSGRKLMSQATDGSTVETLIGPDGNLVSADPSKSLLEFDTTPTLIFPGGIMVRSKPFPESEENGNR